jgi:hypothetical protein
MLKVIGGATPGTLGVRVAVAGKSRTLAFGKVQRREHEPLSSVAYVEMADIVNLDMNIWSLLEECVNSTLRLPYHYLT